MKKPILYVIKLPIGGYRVIKSSYKDLRWAVLTRESLAARWNVHELYQTEEQARAIRPTRLAGEAELAMGEVHGQAVRPCAMFTVKPIVGTMKAFPWVEDDGVVWHE